MSSYLGSEEHKQNTRNAGKIGRINASIARSLEKQERISEYNLNPKKCDNTKCSNILPYDKRNNKFCGSSCAATANNTGRTMSILTKNKISFKSKGKPQSINRKPVTKKSRARCSICNIEFKGIHPSKTGMCVKCFKESPQAEQQRGKTFSKNRKYKIDPRTNISFYLMSSLEELFFDKCIEHDIKFDKPNTISYKDNAGKNHSYFPDFYLPEHNIIIEIKGHLTKEDKIKYDLVLAQNTINWKILYNKDIIPYIESISQLRSELPRELEGHNLP